MKKELIWAYALAIGMKMKVKELIKLLQKYDEEDDVELYCYSVDCANAELIVEPSGDLLMDEWAKEE